MAGSRPASMISIPNMFLHICHHRGGVTGPCGHIPVHGVLDRSGTAEYLAGMTDVNETLDALGLLCPLPVLKARKRLKSLPDGALLRLLADDPAAVVDVPHFCAVAGHALISQTDEDGYHSYLIRKGG